MVRPPAHELELTPMPPVEPSQPSDPLELRHYGHQSLPAIRQTLLDVYAAVPENPAEDPFVQRFPWFVDHWGGNPGFTCVVAYEDENPVGFAYGAPLAEGREWWREHVRPAPEPSRTYAVSELAVLPRWRKTGTATRLHEALLAGRAEDLAVLLVDTTHPRVQALYDTWGYQQVGTQQPFADSPVYAVMLRSLG
jgi:GNAT superfamily N-acetyltransferase